MTFNIPDHLLNIFTEQTLPMNGHVVYLQSIDCADIVDEHRGCIFKLNRTKVNVIGECGWVCCRYDQTFDLRLK